MKTSEKFNRYSRHINKRALEKKVRAKDQKNIPLNHNPLPNQTSGVICGFRSPGFFRVYLGSAEKECKIDKKVAPILSRKLWVGDKITLNKSYEICSCLPRKSILARLRGDMTRISTSQKSLHIIAVNVDVAIIVCSVREPRLTPGLIDRYLILCQYGSITPIICLNKCDLTTSRHPIIEWYKKNLGIQVIETSAAKGIGIEALKTEIEGKFVVFVGTSGVGKSSLINALSGKDLKTQNVSHKNQKGRHTTTSSNLYPLFKDTYVIDTPGIRNLDVTGIDPQELKNYFSEFSKVGHECKYKNCLHYYEPGCAVKAASDHDRMYSIRYKSYLHILTSCMNLSKAEEKSYGLHAQDS